MEGVGQTIRSKRGPPFYCCCYIFTSLACMMYRMDKTRYWLFCSFGQGKLFALPKHFLETRDVSVSP